MLKFSRRIILVFFALTLVASPAARHAGATDSDVKSRLAPTGTLRVALYPGTPTSYLPNVSSPRGVGFELGRDIARRLGVAYEPVIFAKNAEVLEAVKSGKVDMAFTNASASRAKEMDFGPPYLEIELGYLAAKGSPVTSLQGVDRKGVRIGVTEKSSSDAALSRDLKEAELVRIVTIGTAIDMLAAGKIDAFATNKATLFEMSEKLPGSAVLDGNWGLERHAVAIPKGREQALPFLAELTKAMVAEGVVKDAIARAGLRGARVPSTQKN